MLASPDRQEMNSFVRGKVWKMAGVPDRIWNKRRFRSQSPTHRGSTRSANTEVVVFLDMYLLDINAQVSGRHTRLMHKNLLLEPVVAKTHRVEAATTE